MLGLAEIGFRVEPANDCGSGLQTRASHQEVDVLADVIVSQHANRLREVDETQQVVQVLAAGRGRKPLLRGAWWGGWCRRDCALVLGGEALPLPPLGAAGPRTCWRACNARPGLAADPPALPSGVLCHDTGIVGVDGGQRAYAPPFLRVPR